MKNLITPIPVVLSVVFILLSSTAAKATNVDFRSIVQSLPQHFEWKHIRLDGEDSVSIDFELGDALKPTPTESASTAGKDSVKEYYDRFYLKSGSTLKVNGKLLPLTCFWAKAQVKNDDLQTLIFTKIYFVANDSDCTGPILPDTGKDRWETYIHLVRWNYFQSTPKDVFIKYFGNEYKLNPISK